jgi:hypothetical protein
MASLIKLTTILLSVMAIVSAAAVSSSESDGSDLQIKLLTSMAKTALMDHNVQKRAVEYLHRNAKALIPAELSLGAIGLFGTFKAVIIALATIFSFTTFLPAVAGLLGLTFTAPGIVPMRSLDGVHYVVSRSVNEFQHTIQNKTYFLDIDGPDCKERAMCEVGEFVATLPFISNWLAAIGSFEQVIFNEKFNSFHDAPFVKGLRNQVCSREFSNCKKDPFRHWKMIASNF